MEGKEMGTVVVVGRVGAGKSELVSKLVLNGSSSRSGGLPEVSSSMAPCTKKAAAYIFPGESRISPCRLIDTKGLVGCKHEDAEAIRDLAKKVDNLKTIIGVVYVVSEKMDPSERRICDFLFNTLFHDVPAKRTLVVRTKVVDWETYDGESEIEYLREQGNIPGRLLDAAWGVVDLHSSYGISKVVENILTVFSSWETTLKLSNKLDAALEYLSGGNHVDEAGDPSPGASALTNDQTKRIDLVERRINGATSQTQEQRKKLEIVEERINATTSQTEEQREKTEIMEERLNAAVTQVEELKKTLLKVAQHFAGEIALLKKQKEVEEKSEGQIVKVHNPHLEEHQDRGSNLEQQPAVKPSSSQVQQETQRKLLEIQEQNAKDQIAYMEAQAAIQQNKMVQDLVEESMAFTRGFRFPL